jgi:hypothetical protein
MLKTLSFLVGASALAFVGMATVPQTASAGVGVDVGPGGIYVGPRHRHYYDDDDWRWRHRYDHRGAYLDRDHRRYHRD